jgi:hypothetical protein
LELVRITTTKRPPSNLPDFNIPNVSSLALWVGNVRWKRNIELHFKQDNKTQK